MEKLRAFHKKSVRKPTLTSCLTNHQLISVAVSRAKDNFIVFANTRILNKSARTPSGILANHLVYEEESIVIN